MQIKEVGERITLHRSEYRKEFKRCISKQFQSFKKWLTYEQLDFLNELTEEEQQQLKTYLNKKKSDQEKRMINYELTALNSSIKRVSSQFDLLDIEYDENFINELEKNYRQLKRKLKYRLKKEEK